MSEQLKQKIVYAANNTVETNIAKEVTGVLMQQYGQREVLCALFHGLEKLNHPEALPGLREVLKRKDIDE